MFDFLPLLLISQTSGPSGTPSSKATNPAGATPNPSGGGDAGGVRGGGGITQTQEDPIWKKLGFASQADYEDAMAQGLGENPTEYYRVKNFKPTYSSFTPEQMASASGFDTNAWFNQYQNVFNPQGTPDFNYAQEYAGTPVATGYYDVNGNFVGTPMAGAYAMWNLRNLQQPTFVGSASYAAPIQGLQSLIQTMQNYTPMSASGYQAFGEQLGGYAPGTAGQMAGQLQGGISGMQGYTPQEQSTFQRQIQGQIEDMRSQSRDIMSALAGSGRSIAAFEAMDTLAGQIADYNIQAQVQQIINNSARKELEYNALREQYNQIISSGMAGAQQYEKQLQSIWEDMAGGFATELTTLADRDKQNIDIYNSMADHYYKQAVSEIGYDQAALDRAAELYAQAQLPQTDEEWKALMEQIKELLKDLG
jgi:hypothetical protein